MQRRHRARLLEEDLAHDREEFRGAGGAVVAEEGRLTEERLLLQPRELLAHHVRPARIAIAPPEPRGAVRVALLLVELVRELVDDDIAAVVDDGRTFHYVRPGEDDLALRPRFTRERLALLLKDAGNPEGGRRQSLDDERPRIDEDLREVRKIIRLAIEDQQARLRRDRDAHLVGDLLPGATDERFLRDEHLDVLLELALEVARNEAEVGDASNENVAPGRG